MLQVGKSNGCLWCFTAFFLPPEFREADKPLVYLVVGLVQALLSQAQGSASFCLHAANLEFTQRTNGVSGVSQISLALSALDN